jgi:S-adenosylmethionine hydrolase
MGTITLTTDFGTRDWFAGTMKAVILGLHPRANVVDITHEIPPGDIRAGAFALMAGCRYFPKGTVHVAVVDPGVGTRRRPMAAQLGGHYFVGPDNGLFTPIYEDAEKNGWPLKIVHLVNEKYFLAQVSRTFHGRDIFAPVSAHLANGVPLADLGPVISDPLRLQMPKPEKTPTGWRAHVMAADAFGNLTTDLPSAALAEHAQVSFHLRGREVRGLVDSYGQKQPGELVALVDSENYVEIAIVNGSAAQVLGAQVGEVVEVIV